MSKFTLHYFNGSGRAEGIRWVLAHGKANFEDHRISQPDWPKLKGTTTFQLGQIPVLEWTDGKSKATFCQSPTIMRFVAAQLGLAGKTPLETGRADEAYESIREIQEIMFKAMLEPDEAKKMEAMGKLMTDTAPKIFGFLEKRAKENGGKNLAGGNGLTYADLYLGAFFEIIQTRKALDLSPYPTLLAIAKAAAETDGVKAYIAKRPKPDF